VGSVPFRHQGAVRGAYFFILVTHVVLAIAIVPLVVITVRHAFAGRFDAHRRWARRTLPLWAYVSVTGVVIYGMLYHLPPGDLFK
jgi:putative membrane protein